MTKRKQTTTTAAAPRPPSHLSKPIREFWHTVQTDYAVDDAPGLRLLTLACEALDAAESARRVIAKHGQTFPDRFNQPRPRPEVAIQRNAMVTAARLLRELGLSPDDVAVNEFRPPRTPRR